MLTRRLLMKALPLLGLNLEAPAKAEAPRHSPPICETCGNPATDRFADAQEVPSRNGWLHLVATNWRNCCDMHPRPGERRYLDGRVDPAGGFHVTIIRP